LRKKLKNLEVSDHSIFDINWSQFNETDRKILSKNYDSFLETQRTYTQVAASYGSSIRCLFLMMLSSIVLSIAGAENKTILLSVFGLEIAFVALSRIATAAAENDVEKSREEFLGLIKRMR
jgi:hypothetical protein